MHDATVEKESRLFISHILILSTKTRFCASTFALKERSLIGYARFRPTNSPDSYSYVNVFVS